jgi:hypothetical protein
MLLGKSYYILPLCDFHVLEGGSDLFWMSRSVDHGFRFGDDLPALHANSRVAW